MQNEIWKDIEWYEWLYQVSNIGNIKSLNYASRWYERILKGIKNNHWYIHISLYREWKSKSVSIHRTVLYAFLPNPENKLEVNHINWIKTDNKLENLEWCTRKENALHSYRVLWYKMTDKAIENAITNWKKNWKQIMQLTKEWILCKIHLSCCSAERETWITNSNISMCARWIRRIAWGYLWKYVDDNQLLISY